jgi:hypothetical protein
VALTPNSKTIPQVFIFQYNPEMLIRTISSPNGGEVSKEEGQKHGTTSLVELINLNLEFDATGQLEHPDQHRDFVQKGFNLTLAAIESIMYSQSKINDRTSTIVFFVWGNRTIPIWIESLKITEEAFDPNLNPIRVRIELSMRVRKLSEFKTDSPGHAICARYFDHRLMLAQLYNKDELKRDFLKQVSRNIQNYLGMKKSSLNKQNNKKRLQNHRD